MNLFQRLSIRGKVTVVIMATSGVAILLASAAILTYQIIDHRKSTNSSVITLADIVGANSTAALAFDDPIAAGEILSALRTVPSIDLACIYDGEGEILARYMRSGSTEGNWSTAHERSISGLGHGHVDVFRTIEHEGEVVGKIFIRSDLHGVGDLAVQYGGIVGLFLVATCLVALLLSTFFQRLISNPIRHLAETAKSISLNRDYSVRASTVGDDEIGILTVGFNEMLTQIQSRDRKLEEHRNSLERRVEERTEELTRTNEDLRAAKERAEAASRAKNEFVANASHELRTPLTGITGMTQILRETSLDHDQRECADVIGKCAETLLGVINDVLDFSKIAEGKLGLKNVDFDLLPVIQDVVDMVSFRASERGIVLTSSHDEGLPCSLRGDSGRLRQILLNLVGNATKFTEQGEISIAVGLERETELDATLRFVVRDTGIGIPADRIEDLFESFSQVDTSLSRKYGGTGLGLTISKQLVELMGGEIGVESTEGKGSTFWFTVVVAKQAGRQADMELATTRDPVVALAVEPRIPDGTLRILVAEDNPVIQKVTSRIMERLGYEVDVVDSGKGVLSALDRQKYDLIFMDCQMPEMDGFEATRKVRLLDRSIARIPIIALTAHAAKGDRERCLEVGMDDYLSKPMKLEDLVSMIEKWSEPKAA